MASPFRMTQSSGREHAVFFFQLRPQASTDKNRLSGHAGPVVFILKARRINLIHIFNDSAFPVIVREKFVLRLALPPPCYPSLLSCHELPQSFQKQ
jgi:hypothetical protein